jgi:hypothetical protein
MRHNRSSARKLPGAADVVAAAAVAGAAGGAAGAAAAAAGAAACPGAAVAGVRRNSRRRKWAVSTALGSSSLLRQLRQLGDVRRDLARLAFTEQLGRRAATGFAFSSAELDETSLRPGATAQAASRYSPRSVSLRALPTSGGGLIAQAARDIRRD